MAQKDFTGRGVDIFDDIALTLDVTSKRVGRRENVTRPVVPRYKIATGVEGNGDFPLNPIEGQIALGIDDNNLWYYVNGEWRSGVAGVWKDIDLEDPWVSVGLPWGPPQYMYLAGTYFFRGAFAGGTDADLLTVIEEEDRPEFKRRFMIEKSLTFAFLEIYPTGNVFVISS